MDNKKARNPTYLPIIRTSKKIKKERRKKHFDYPKRPLLRNKLYRTNYFNNKRKKRNSSKTLLNKKDKNTIKLTEKRTDEINVHNLKHKVEENL